MGWRDNMAEMRRAAKIKQANPGMSGAEAMRLVEEERGARYSDHFAPDAVETYIEVVPAKAHKRDTNAFVRTYIGIVGLRPEDVFAIYPEPRTEVIGDLNIVYRDRPEYADGRSRFRRVVLEKQ